MIVHWRAVLLLLILVAGVLYARQPESKPLPARIAQARLSAAQWKEDLLEINPGYDEFRNRIKELDIPK